MGNNKALKDILIIESVFNALNIEGYTHNPRIVDAIPTGDFKKQESDIPGVKHEWVDQRSGGHPAGDDYYSTYVVQLHCGKYLAVDYG